METIKLHIKQSGIRLLAVLRDHLSNQLTTKKLRWLIEHHRCKVNGKIECFCSYKVTKGDTIELVLDLPPPPHIDQEDVLFEDEHVLFYNKPAFIASNDLADQLKCYLVHRLDRDTTGVIVFAKTMRAKTAIENLFRQREIEKYYLAYVSFAPSKSSGTIDIRLEKKAVREGASKAICSSNGKEAITHWKVLTKNKHRTLVELHPTTGRMHQLRAHLAAIGCPIVGDVIYGSRKQIALRPLLHASTLKFKLFDQTYDIEAPLPEDFS